MESLRCSSQGGTLTFLPSSRFWQPQGYHYVVIESTTLTPSCCWPPHQYAVAQEDRSFSPCITFVESLVPPTFYSDSRLLRQHTRIPRGPHLSCMLVAHLVTRRNSRFYWTSTFLWNVVKMQTGVARNTLIYPTRSAVGQLPGCRLWRGARCPALCHTPALPSVWNHS